MKKILIIGDYCYPNYAGGSSKHVYDLMKNFPSEFDLKLITRAKNKANRYVAHDDDAENVYRIWKHKGRVKELTYISIINPFFFLCNPEKINQTAHGFSCCKSCDQKSKSIFQISSAKQYRKYIQYFCQCHRQAA